MAIAVDRLIDRNLTELVNTDFIDDLDTSEDTPSNQTSESETKSQTNKNAEAIGKANAFDTLYGTLSNILLFGDCDYDINSFQRKANLNIKNNNLNKPIIPDGCSDPLTRVLKSLTVLDTYLSTLSDSALFRLENLVSNQFGELLGFTNNINNLHDSASNTQSIINSIIGMMNAIGGTLTQKLTIKNLEALCYEDIFNNDLGFDLLNEFILGLSLNLAECLQNNRLLGFMTDLLDSGSYTKIQLVSSLMGNFKSSENTKTADKVQILHSLIKTGEEDEENKITDKDLIHTVGKTSIIIESLSDTEVTSKSPMTEYKNLIEALNILDPSWNRNPDTNEIDMSVVKGNTYFTTLANKYLSSVTSDDIVLTLTPGVISDDNGDHDNDGVINKDDEDYIFERELEQISTMIMVVNHDIVNTNNEVSKYTINNKRININTTPINTLKDSSNELYDSKVDDISILSPISNSDNKISNTTNSLINDYGGGIMHTNVGDSEQSEQTTLVIDNQASNAKDGVNNTNNHGTTTSIKPISNDSEEIKKTKEQLTLDPVKQRTEVNPISVSGKTNINVNNLKETPSNVNGYNNKTNDIIKQTVTSVNQDTTTGNSGNSNQSFKEVEAIKNNNSKTSTPLNKDKINTTNITHPTPDKTKTSLGKVKLSDINVSLGIKDYTR